MLGRLNSRIGNFHSQQPTTHFNGMRFPPLCQIIFRELYFFYHFGALIVVYYAECMHYDFIEHKVTPFESQLHYLLLFLC